MINKNIPKQWFQTMGSHYFTEQEWLRDVGLHALHEMSN